MLDLVTRHSFIAICLAIFLEELGVPMPIPTDILIIFAGAASGQSFAKLTLWFVLISIVSALGSSGLYLIVRRGGRPLVERFGRYVHLGPEQLMRAEQTLNRTGWFGIACGRALPGVRYVTVIACGLLRVPYGRYITAHIAGSSVYIVVFLTLGSYFGPMIAERLHAPEIVLRLLWLGALSLGLPLLLGWLCVRGHARYVAEPSRWRQFSALLLASFLGSTSLAATWAGVAALTEVLGDPRSIDMSHMLARILLSTGFRASHVSALILVYAGILLICAMVGVCYYELIQPRLASHRTPLLHQALGLALLGGIVVASCFSIAMLFGHLRPIQPWWSSDGSLVLLAVMAGVLSYTLTTVFGRALAIAVLPSLRRNRSAATPPAAAPECLEVVPQPPSEPIHPVPNPQPSTTNTPPS